MRQFLVAAVFTLLVVLRVAGAEPEVRLIVNAVPASVDVPRHPGTRRHVRPGVLEFPISIVAECNSGDQAESVSISVADSRQLHRLPESKSPVQIETTIRLPARQAAPIVIEKFCTTEDGPRAPNRLLVAAAFTAHVSLRCSGENRQSIHYATAPLDISFRCSGKRSPASDPAEATNLPW